MQSNDSSQEQSPQTPVYRSSSKRIAKNTLMLYFRQILIMLVSLYTVRVILNTLGAVDYGIYNVVAGVVTMFGFLSGAMAAASQRYFAFEMGRGNNEELRKIFSVMMTIYILLALIILLLAETIGLWFVYHKLVIPPERFNAAKWIYQFSIFSFMISLLTSPYMASIIAHENMSIYAYMSILEAILKLLIVFLLRILPFDKLIVYGGLLLTVTCINTGLYRFYCKKNYTECRFGLTWEKKLSFNILKYMGLDLYGNLAVMLRTQGVNILFNLFFGPIVNAAAAIATSAQSAILNFSGAILSAIKPQIIKTYSSNNIEKMKYLIDRGFFVVFLLLSMLSIPVMVDINYLLKLWLGNIPSHAPAFCQATLIFAVIAGSGGVVVTGAHAVGDIRRPSIINGSLYILVIPISYVMFKLDFPPVSAYIINAIMVFLGLLSNIYTLKVIIPGFDFFPLLIAVIKGITAFAVNYLILSLLKQNTRESFRQFVLMCLISFIFTFIFLLLNLSKNERNNLTKIVLRRK